MKKYVGILLFRFWSESLFLVADSKQAHMMIIILTSFIIKKKKQNLIHTFSYIQNTRRNRNRTIHIIHSFQISNVSNRAFRVPTSRSSDDTGAFCTREKSKEFSVWYIFERLSLGFLPGFSYRLWTDRPPATWPEAITHTPLVYIIIHINKAV